MKTKLLFTLLISSTMLLHAQLNVWTGTVDDKWSNEDNWTGTVPTASDDVLIPSGFAVTIDDPADILSLEVQGNSILNVTSPIIIANPSEFEDNVVVNWISGDLTGPGILLNSGTINLSFTSFDLTGSIVLNNPGIINLIGGNITIGSDSVLNNSGTGIIDFQTNGSMFSASSGSLNNYGTIKTSFANPTDQGFIGSDFINHSGIFQIDSGTLNINNTLVNLMGGNYNVAAGATLNLNSPMMVSGILSGNVFGSLNWDNDMSITSTAVFDFMGNSIINNTGGDLIGGGLLTNQSIITIDIGGLVITDGTDIENNGEIRLISSSNIRLDSGTTINNNLNALIDFQTNGGNIESLGIADDTRILNNFGLIKTSFPNPNDESLIRIKLNNNNGTLQIDNGTLNLNYAGITLNDGIYNIASSGVLGWSLPITILGNLTGNLSGTLNWDADLIVPSNATFNFSGNGIINWDSFNLDGGGTLTNNNIIVKSSGGTKRINNATTLNNNGEIRQLVGGSISIATSSVLNNNASGIINLNATTSGFNTFGNTPNLLNNSGIINSNAASGNTNISCQLNNSGVVNVIQNGINFSGVLNNEASGTIKGIGTVFLPANSNNFTNNGVFAPGASPGILNIVGNYHSNASSAFDLELDGLIQGTEYDLLAIQGNASFDGGIQVTLSFDANIGDEFIIATVSGTINTCNLPAMTTADYNGSHYEFNVECRNNDEVVLTVTNETLSINSIENEQKPIILYPNPANTYVSFSDERIESIQIFDLNGREVLQNNSHYIFITSLSKGLYIVKGSSKNGRTIIKQLIKN